MTKTPNEFPHLLNDEETIEEWRDTAERVLNTAIKSNVIHEETYKQYLLEIYEGEDIDEAAAFYTDVIDGIIQAMIEMRITNGSVYLDRSDLTESERERGMKLYDELCAELEKYRKAS